MAWIPAAVGIFGLASTLVAARTGEGPFPAGSLVLLIVVAVAVPLWLWRIRLITTVAEGRVIVRFAGLWKTRTISIGQIQRAEARTYRPIREYGGWGIRWGGNGWAYNVRGNQGVQLKLKSGKSLLIGSRRPDELEKAITSSPQYNPNEGL